MQLFIHVHRNSIRVHRQTGAATLSLLCLALLLLPCSVSSTSTLPGQIVLVQLGYFGVLIPPNSDMDYRDMDYRDVNVLM